MLLTLTHIISNKLSLPFIQARCHYYFKIFCLNRKGDIVIVKTMTLHIYGINRASSKYRLRSASGPHGIVTGDHTRRSIEDLTHINFTSLFSRLSSPLLHSVCAPAKTQSGGGGAEHYYKLQQLKANLHTLTRSH